MNTREGKSQVDRVVASLRGELDHWEELLARLSPQELMASRSSKGWSVRDFVAHLKAWQQVSNGRMEAAVNGTEPVLPDWLGGEDPESEAHLHAFNDTIHEAHRGQPWERVHRDWRAGYERLLRLASEVTEADMADATRFPWLKGYALIAVLEGSLAHHREHREALFGVRS